MSTWHLAPGTASLRGRGVAHAVAQAAAAAAAARVAEEARVSPTTRSGPPLHTDALPAMHLALAAHC